MTSSSANPYSAVVHRPAPPGGSGVSAGAGGNGVTAGVWAPATPATNRLTTAIALLILVMERGAAYYSGTLELAEKLPESGIRARVLVTVIGVGRHAEHHRLVGRAARVPVTAKGRPVGHAGDAVLGQAGGQRGGAVRQRRLDERSAAAIELEQPRRRVPRSRERVGLVGVVVNQERRDGVRGAIIVGA